MLWHGDLAERVAIATDALPWVAREGFSERLLELAEDRITGILHIPAGGRLPFAPRGYFDLLILDGVLRGSTRYPARTYLRDRAGVALISEGATVLVKQRFDGEPPPLCIDTARVGFRPSVDGYVGVEFADLVRDDTGSVVLMRLSPGATIPRHDHALGEEFFALSGSLADEGGRYHAAHWVRQPPASVHSIRSDEGALTFIFAHHLAR